MFPRKLLSKIPSSPFGFFSKKKPSSLASEATHSDPPIPLSINAITDLRKELAHRLSLAPSPSPVKLTLFLELDGVLFQTFIPHKTEAYFNKPTRPHDFEFDVNINNEDVPVMIYMRPHWREFLSFIRKNTETVIYTSVQDYFLDQLIQKIGSENFDLIQHKLCQEDCGVLKSEYDGLEELSKSIEGIGRSLNRSVLIDHSPLNFMAEPNNGIPILEYDANNDRKQTDDKLLDTIEILEQLLREKDVRVFLKQKYGIEKMVKEINYV